MCKLAELFFGTRVALPELGQKLCGKLRCELAAESQLKNDELGLIESEAHFHADLYIHRPAIFHCRLEAPLFYCFYGLGVEPETETADYSYVTRMSLVIDDKPEDACSLRLGETSLLGIFRIRSAHGLWRGYAAANFEHSTADSATTAGSHACTVTYAYATTRA